MVYEHAMIHEYAIDPATLSSWERVRYFLDQVGVQHGRLIAQFPERWENLVYESCSACGDSEKKNIEVRLMSLSPYLLNSRRAFSPELCWLANAMASHAERGFQAVITEQAVDGHEFIVAAAAVNDADPLWHTERRRRVPRTPDAMAECVGLLLSFARILLFVDPHFAPKEPRYYLPFRRFMAVVAERGAGHKPSRIEVHASVKSVERAHRKAGRAGDAIANFESACRKYIGRFLPKGLVVRFALWREREKGERMHARYLMTELGGVGFDVGLDVRADENSRETTDVTLLEPGFRSGEFEVRSSTAFDLTREFIIP